MAADSKKPRGTLRLLIRWIALVAIVLFLLPYALAVAYRAVDPVSTLMLWRWATGARVARTWMPIGEMASALPLAAISAEDGQFCSHRGIDFGELRQAVMEADDLSEARGGSTITQQTAKNLFLWQSRSFIRKGLELPLALWLELVLGKRRIMEIYLNVAEWGPNGEFGAQAGARYAFGKSAADLTAGEAALLVSVLPNPHQRDARRPGPGLRRVAATHLARMTRMTRADRCLR